MENNVTYLSGCKAERDTAAPPLPPSVRARIRHLQARESWSPEFTAGVTAYAEAAVALAGFAQSPPCPAS